MLDISKLPWLLALALNLQSTMALPRGIPQETPSVVDPSTPVVSAASSVSAPPAALGATPTANQTWSPTSTIYLDASSSVAITFTDLPSPVPRPVLQKSNADVKRDMIGEMAIAAAAAGVYSVHLGTGSVEWCLAHEGCLGDVYNILAAKSIPEERYIYQNCSGDQLVEVASLAARKAELIAMSAASKQLVSPELSVPDANLVALVDAFALIKYGETTNITANSPQNVNATSTSKAHALPAGISWNNTSSGLPHSRNTSFPPSVQSSNSSSGSSHLSQTSLPATVPGDSDGKNLSKNNAAQLSDTQRYT